jgi:hypothetical protein
MGGDLHRRALARAVKIAGGKDRLAAYLKVDAEFLSRLLAGQSEPPLKVLQSLARLLKHELLRQRR